MIYTLSKTLISISKGLDLERTSPPLPKLQKMKICYFFLFKMLQLGVSPENTHNQ